MRIFHPSVQLEQPQLHFKSRLIERAEEQLSMIYFQMVMDHIQ